MARKTRYKAATTSLLALVVSTALVPGVAGADENPVGSDFYTMDLLAELNRAASGVNDGTKVKQLAGQCWPALEGLPTIRQSEVHKINHTSTRVTSTQPSGISFTLTFDADLMQRNAPGACRSVTYSAGQPKPAKAATKVAGRWEVPEGAPPERNTTKRQVDAIFKEDYSRYESEWGAAGKKCWEDIKDADAERVPTLRYSTDLTDVYIDEGGGLLIVASAGERRHVACTGAHYLIPIEGRPDRPGELALPRQTVEFADRLMRAWLGGNQQTIGDMATPESAALLTSEKPDGTRWFRVGHAYSKVGLAFLYKSESGEGLLIEVPYTATKGDLQTGRASADFVKF